MYVFELSRYAELGMVEKERFPVLVTENLHTQMLANIDNLTITAAVTNYMFEHYHGEPFSVNMCKFSQTEKMIEAENVIINVNYIDNRRGISADLEHESMEIVDKKVKNITINTYIPKKLPKLNQYLFQELIHHEYSHFTHNKNLYIKLGKDLMSYVKDYIDYPLLLKRLKAKLANGADKDDLLIELIIYRLFVKTETDAFIAQTYSALEGIGSKCRNDYSEDICRTVLYKSYSQLRENVKKLKDAKPGDFVIAHSYFNDNRIKKMSDEKFKNWFINQSDFRLDYVWRKMAAAAMSYYVKKEFEEELLSNQDIKSLKNDETPVYGVFLEDEYEYRRKYVEHVVTVKPITRIYHKSKEFVLYVYLRHMTDQCFVSEKRLYH